MSLKLEQMVEGDTGSKMFAVTLAAQIHEGQASDPRTVLHLALEIDRWLTREESDGR